MSDSVLIEIRIAKAYTVFFWCLYLLPSLLIIPFPFIYWYKKRVVDRNYIELYTKTLHLYQGRWFVCDDDVVYTNAVDHIKIDRSILGYIFGWCTLIITTRNGQFIYDYMDMKNCESLRNEVIT